MTPPRSEDAPSTSKIISLQWLRFLAGSMVLVYHASVYLNLIHQNQYGLERFPTWYGSVGVALFFALSGNLMATAMMKSTAPQFLLHRVGRIYPAFYIVTGLVVLASFFTPARALLDLHALTLFPYGKTSYPLGVEWTLVFEIAFYMFVFLLILFKKTQHASAFLIGWLALILVHNHPSGDPSPSSSDIAMTRKIRDAAQLMQIQFLDHVIIAEQRFTSFAEHGLLA